MAPHTKDDAEGLWRSDSAAVYRVNHAKEWRDRVHRQPTLVVRTASPPPGQPTSCVLSTTLGFAWDRVWGHLPWGNTCVGPRAAVLWHTTDQSMWLVAQLRMEEFKADCHKTVGRMADFFGVKRRPGLPAAHSPQPPYYSSMIVRSLPYVGMVLTVCTVGTGDSYFMTSRGCAPQSASSARVTQTPVPSGRPITSLFSPLRCAHRPPSLI